MAFLLFYGNEIDSVMEASQCLQFITEEPPHGIEGKGAVA
jgi:hypothetical protein